MKKDKRNDCHTKTCTNKCVYKYCSTCSSRKTREKDPIRYTWLNLKNRAKQRPKEFTITLEEFRKWCIDNDFVPGRGDSVDRINNGLGYHITNIQKIPLIENIRKYYDHDRWQPATQTEENPF